MTDQPASPRLKARIAGVLYLAVIVTGSLGLALRSGLIVRGDAVATANHILASEPLYRWSLAADLAGGAFYVAITAILYGLLKPVSRTISLMAAFFSLAGITIGAAITANLLTPLILLQDAPYLAAFSLEQRQALALAALKLHSQGYSIGQIFFGLYCLTLGWLVFRSGFLPRIVGGLLALAGVGWLTASFAALLSPALSSHLYPAIMAPGIIGELSFTLWLLVMGVDAAKWQARAAAGVNP